MISKSRRDRAAPLPDYQAEQVAKAVSVYVGSHPPGADAAEWQDALRRTRKPIGAALRASDYLRDVAVAILADGRHARVLRYLLAPPLSQDQTALFYPAWRKATENDPATHARVPASKPADANAFAQAVRDRRAKWLTPWLDASRAPTVHELRRLYLTVGSLLAYQDFVTAQRTHLAAVQEQAVIDMLDADGWTRLPASMFDTRGELAPKQYAHKTRFATDSAKPQEVDIAMGLAGTIVLAMECKVTNDATNSIKRINDILKKAKAWQEHWGHFVTTAALLQGVIRPGDVQRLLDAKVEVFWSHDLEYLRSWLAART